MVQKIAGRGDQIIQRKGVSAGGDLRRGRDVGGLEKYEN